MTNTDITSAAVAAWFAERLLAAWAQTPPEVVLDREEITVVLSVPAPDPVDGATEAEHAQAVAGRVARFRAETRDQRIAVAREAEHRFDRKVAWGVQCGQTRELFTHLAVPVMTRLRQPDRLVLDTLVDAGVARSRAHALAWCVRLVGENAGTWLADLRGAMENVAKVRDAGPGASAG